MCAKNDFFLIKVQKRNTKSLPNQVFLKHHHQRNISSIEKKTEKQKLADQLTLCSLKMYVDL